MDDRDYEIQMRTLDLKERELALRERELDFTIQQHAERLEMLAKSEGMLRQMIDHIHDDDTDEDNAPISWPSGGRA